MSTLFTPEDALDIVKEAVAEARLKGYIIAAVVVDPSCEPIAAWTDTGIRPGSHTIAYKKACTAMLEGVNTQDLVAELSTRGVDAFNAFYMKHLSNESRILALSGADVIVKGNIQCGGFGLSGANNPVAANQIVREVLVKLGYR